ncbi:MAG: cytochrome c biogenesis protein CcsA [Desulfobacca sp.]|nr:cytochrome c biogenesis protein CcsA [Desulfobacca sp.]
MPYETNIFYLAVVCYGLSASALWFRWSGLSFIFLGLGLLANTGSACLRMINSWPLLCLYQEPFLLPLGLAVVTLWLARHRQPTEAVKIIPLIALLAIIPVFFPKDFFLPFLKSHCIFSHLFLYLGVAARACFLAGAVLAGAFLWARHRNDQGQQAVAQLDFPTLLIWGYVFLSLALFSAGLWSYCGWGTLVVWEDAMVLAIAATWFLYACFLHLHLNGRWSVTWRAGFALAAGLVVIVFNYWPETGKFQLPGGLW